MRPRPLLACIVLSIASRHAETACDEGTQGESEDELAVHLLQFSSATPKRGGAAAITLSQGQMCAPLYDEGASFTVLVEIGTAFPNQVPQALRLVADTGSNAMVVTSCFCNLLTPLGSGCQLFQDCFVADAHVTPTFMLSGLEKDLAYGSGAIECDVGSDFASLPSTDLMAYMQDGLFLLRDRHELDVGADFLGIFGLGIPGAPDEDADIVPEKLFMASAGVPRYSICFDLFNGGALKTGFGPLQHRLTSVGVYHWGVGVTGIRAGNTSSELVACGPGMPEGGTSTPCAMIPDSGTTQILGPSDQVSALLAGLCAQWPRCLARANSIGLEPSAAVFNALLIECSDWLTPEEGINEVPSIFFDLVGENDGESQTIELSPESWVLAATLFTIQTRNVTASALLQERASNATIIQERVCIADIGTMAYPTTKNGPVWILGQALFFQGTVSYDTTAYPPFMSFDMDKPCSCELPDANRSTPLSVAELNSASVFDSIRHVSGSPRQPVLDTSLPL